MDGSAIVHLGSKNAHYTNTFRLTAVLTEPVDSLALQKAVDHITPRFPTLVAGIQHGAFQFWVVPAALPPAVEADTGCLNVMSDEMLRRCAVRVLYRENAVSVEVFHSLTDGCGGLAFLTALLAEYAVLRWGAVPAPVCAVYAAGHERENLAHRLRAVRGTVLLSDALQSGGSGNARRREAPCAADWAGTQSQTEQPVQLQRVELPGDTGSHLQLSGRGAGIASVVFSKMQRPSVRLTGNRNIRPADAAGRMFQRRDRETGIVT
ncbi:hypothetical protein [Gemmiger sp.]|uniref:hypothetical protein n=1 Tax=Gemmiger sp. TaxID=2049027 RepID=UPI003F120231